MRIQREHAIGRAARSGELAVVECEGVDECVGVDVVEIITRGNLRGTLREQSREVGVFAVEIDNVRIEASLLQEIGVTSQIGDPRVSLLGPGLVTGEPLSIGAEGETGLSVQQR